MDQGNAALRIQIGQRRPQHEDFADAGLVRHEFYQGTQGPSLSWQFLVKRLETCSDGGMARARKL